MDILELEEQIKSGYLVDEALAMELIERYTHRELMALAERLRLHFLGSKIDTCSIINARSGRCSEDCKWCSQSKFFKTSVEVYPLISREKALEMALHNASKGVGRFSLVTSGRAVEGAQMDEVCEIYRTIAKETPIKLCASMGLISREDMQKLADCGIGHYHCNLETAPSHFSTLCSTHTIEDKLKTISYARDCGMRICSGGIIGMGESMAQRVELAVLLQKSGVDSIPINILNPIKGTPLEKSAPLTDVEVLTTFAIFRIINPKAKIRFAGGRLQIEHIQEQALKGGISGALVGDLLTTVGDNIDRDMAMFRRLGFEIAVD